jgi:hypothetical protein
MGLQSAPAYIGVGGFTHPVELDRNILESLFQRSGVLKGGDFALSPTAGQLALTIGSGSAIIVGNESGQVASQGAYYAWSNGSESLAWPAPSGSPRVDTLLLQVYDPQYGTITGLPRVEWRIITGVPAASPVARPESDYATGGSLHEPGAYLKIADIRINTGDTAINAGLITPAVGAFNLNARRYTGTAAQRAAASGFIAGDEWYETDTNRNLLWTGAAWKNPAYTATWTNLTLASGFIAQASETPQYRLQGSRVSFRGAVARTAGATFTFGTSYTVATAVPAAIRPTFGFVRRFTVNQYSSSASAPAARVELDNSTGNLSVIATSTGATGPLWVGLEFEYDLD